MPDPQEADKASRLAAAEHPTQPLALGDAGPTQPVAMDRPAAPPADVATGPVLAPAPVALDARSAPTATIPETAEPRRYDGLVPWLVVAAVGLAIAVLAVILVPRVGGEPLVSTTGTPTSSTTPVAVVPTETGGTTSDTDTGEGTTVAPVAPPPAPAPAPSAPAPSPTAEPTAEPTVEPTPTPVPTP